jgi:hypothetical protein
MSILREFKRPLGIAGAGIRGKEVCREVANAAKRREAIQIQNSESKILFSASCSAPFASLRFDDSPRTDSENPRSISHPLACVLTVRRNSHSVRASRINL